ncbi:hypothetical protein ES703_29354 [subsurface metagenome]
MGLIRPSVAGYLLYKFEPMRKRLKLRQRIFNQVIINAKILSYGDGGSEVRKIGSAGQWETIANLLAYIVS